MSEKEKEKPKPKKLSRSDNAIPDYEYLFEESSDKSGAKKSNFFRKLVKINK